MDVNTDSLPLKLNPKHQIEYYAPNAITVPIVSIITTVYKFNAELLPLTASTVFHSSFQNWEWLIVDDDIIESVALTNYIQSLNDKRVRRIRTIHYGLPGARNLGIEHSKGQFIYILDDDDYIEPLALEMLYFTLITNRKLSFANGYTTGFESENYFWEKGFQPMKVFVTRNEVHCSAMIRKDDLLLVGGYNASRTSGLEDWELWLRFANNGMWGYTIKEGK